ncbi:CobW/HypB/UreG, nucleotide-binding domain-containing protein [Stachybotrys elegans]|uniref:CobW/HypB/UreG, nucleotide-binding domain-containing protein n=1 Tax=Stachybotrys elegans TaxID=80388 RepID=A0A8K0WUJ0_9HYPO|nr:CobW/HypB/UreG, nucleotide-binding domain-containing protein [Stachybotrys elegans]KAH7325651.1 CobW/HypB/UreG, nucleotide-binding domain-containing protein [Stachybotrys elegans]
MAKPTSSVFKKRSPKRPSKRHIKPLPVTLLSGFLGAGKTTLLHHILRSNHGLRIAIIVNDIGAINVDASLIKKTHTLRRTEEKVIALQNGCICCNLRGDLLEELVRLSKLAKFDYVIIESSGISEPEQVAETFDTQLSEEIHAVLSEQGVEIDEGMRNALLSIKKAGGIEKFARLDTTVTVIDAFTMLNDFDTADGLASRRDDVVPEDERSVSDLMVDQIEFADVIILNKIDMVDKEAKEVVLRLIKSLNHRAKIIESIRGKVDAKEIINTGSFDMERAKTGQGWLQDLHDMTVHQVNGRNVVTPKPETEEYNVGNFIYVRHRPFNPRRLWELLFDKFILQFEATEEEEGDDDDEQEDGGTENGEKKDSGADHADQDRTDEDNDELETPPKDVVLANKRANPVLARLFRSKGQIFLATRPHRSAIWSQAGGMLTITGGIRWFCTLDPSEYQSGTKEIDDLVEFDIKAGGEWGDRRQELVFIGERIDRPGLEKLLDHCLLNDEEYDQWAAVMRDSELDDEKRMERLQDMFDDGWPDWMADLDEFNEEDDEDASDDDAHGTHSHHRPVKKLRSIKESLANLPEVD